MEALFRRNKGTVLIAGIYCLAGGVAGLYFLPEVVGFVHNQIAYHPHGVLDRMHYEYSHRRESDIWKTVVPSVIYCIGMIGLTFFGMLCIVMSVSTRYEVLVRKTVEDKPSGTRTSA